MSKKLIAGAGVAAAFAVALAPLATFATTPAAGNEYVSQLDKLSVTIEPYCSFGYAFKDGSTTTAHGLHTDGSTNSTSATTIKNTDTYGNGSGQYGQGHGNWRDGANAVTELSPVVAASAPDAAADVAYGVMENGTYQLAFAKTKLTVVCNNRAGYSITAQSEDLTDDAEAVSDVFDQTNATPSGAASTWSFQFQNADGFALNNRTEGGSAASAAAWLDASGNSGLVVASMAPTTTGDNQNPSAATTTSGDSYEATYGVGVSPTMPAGTYSGTILYTLAQL